MAKEITDIIEEIHEYFSEYNEFVRKKQTWRENMKKKNWQMSQ